MSAEYREMLREGRDLLALSEEEIRAAVDRMREPTLAGLRRLARARKSANRRQRGAASYGASTIKPTRHRRTREDLLDIRDAIAAAVAADSPVTVRGVFYRVVAAGAVPKTEAGYRTVGRLTLAMRREGALGYEEITDGTRWVIRPRTYDSVEDMLAEVRKTYRRDLWRAQPVEVHVYCEKDAITGVLEPVTREWDVPLAVARGYMSETFAYELGRAVAAARKPVIVYQFGDHDPSGIGAWEHAQRRVAEFAGGADVRFERLAVTPAQIAAWDLPTRPTKATDTRARSFEGESVEVDAIPASTLRDILAAAIEQHIDQRQLAVTRRVEESEREALEHVWRGFGSAEARP
jgi:hypothetical protein